MKPIFQSAASRPASRLAHTVLAAALALATTLACMPGAASAQAAAPAFDKPPPPPTVSAMPAPRPLGELERIATSSGVRTCLDAVRSAGSTLTGPENGYAARLMLHPAGTDGSFSASIERAAASATGSSLVSAFFMPTAKGGCDIGYDMVDFWNKSCQDVVLQDLQYPQEWAQNVIGRQVHVVLLGARLHVYLMRVPGGCVTIKKEMVYR